MVRRAKNNEDVVYHDNGWTIPRKYSLADALCGVVDEHFEASAVDISVWVTSERNGLTLKESALHAELLWAVRYRRSHDHGPFAGDHDRRIVGRMSGSCNRMSARCSVRGTKTYPAAIGGFVVKSGVANR